MFSTNVLFFALVISFITSSKKRPTTFVISFSLNCQVELKKPVLKNNSFDEMKIHILQVLKTPEDFAAQVWSILCNDLGKVHSIVDEYQKISEKVSPGTI